MRPTPHQLMIREMILQLKRGFLDASYFRKKFGADILQEWADVWHQYQEEQWVRIEEDRVELTREGLLRVDALLPSFFEPQHRGVRYT
jgi:oxygen-independent coproporphyrinogen-3 oxidase